MVITGSISTDGKGTELHRDQSNVTDCDEKYTNPAYPVCPNIIAISISSNQSWRYVKMSTKNYLMLCEVKAFAGKTCYIKLISIVHLLCVGLLDVKPVVSIYQIIEIGLVITHTIFHSLN